MGRFLRGELKLIDTFNFVSGQRQQRELSVPEKFIKRLWISVRGTLTISGVTVPGTIHQDGPSRAIATVQLDLDGQPLKIGSLSSFLRLSQRYDESAGSNFGLVSPAAGVYPFQVVVPLFFESQRSVNPLDSLVDGRFVKNMVLTLTWGAAADMLVGNTSTVALTALSAEIYFKDTEPFPIDFAFWRFEEFETLHDNIITNQQSRLILPYKLGSVLRAIQLRAIDGADVSDDVINALTLRINGGEQPWRDVEDDFLRASSQHEFGLDSVAEGYYHLELAENGRVLSTGLGAGNQELINTLDILADTTVGVGATSIVSHLVQYVPADTSVGEPQT